MSLPTHSLMCRLHFLMDLADRSFENYLPQKFYLHALCLRKTNQLIHDLIIGHLEEFPADLYSHFATLLCHYDIWMIQFNHFENVRPFALNEPFVFHHLDDKSAYPKDAATFIRKFV